MNWDWFDQNRNWGITVLRVAVGVVFFAHGWMKAFEWGLAGTAGGFREMGLPLPYLSAVMATGAELIGGALLALGLFTRYAAAPLAFTMVVAGVTAHSGSFFLPTGFEYVLVLFAASVAVLFTGPGALAMDNALAGRRRKELTSSPAPA